MSTAKKVGLGVLLFVLLGGGVFGYLYTKWTADPQAFAGWHHSLEKSMSAAAKQSLPLMVKVGAKY